MNDDRKAAVDRRDPRLSSPFGAELAWYWEMRADLFSLVDEGIQFDEVGLVGVKPEAAALRCALRLPGRIALDAFAGIGGSAIALARTGKRVVSLDIDAARLRIARHNAKVYGVADRIFFARGDARQLLHAARVDCVYLDPPWGGMEAAERPRFGLRDFHPRADELLAAALATTSSVAMSVPPNFDFPELEPYRPDLIEPVVRYGEVLYYDVFFVGGHPLRSARGRTLTGRPR